MKKFVFFAAVAAVMLMSSCTRSIWTATNAPIATAVSSTNVADLEVGGVATYTYRTNAAERRDGVANCKRAALAAMCKANKAEVIVAPQFHYSTTLEAIEVVGRPAVYKNFRGAN